PIIFAASQFALSWERVCDERVVGSALLGCVPRGCAKKGEYKWAAGGLCTRGVWTDSCSHGDATAPLFSSLIRCVAAKERRHEGADRTDRLTQKENRATPAACKENEREWSSSPRSGDRPGSPAARASGDARRRLLGTPAGGPRRCCRQDRGCVQRH